MNLYNNLINKDRRKKLRRDATPQEIVIWSRIRNNQLGIKFKRQYGISNFIVDFCAPKIKLIIEIDGSQHIDNKYDLKRTEILQSLGFKVLRFWNGEINTNIEGVLLKIISALPPPLPG